MRNASVCYMACFRFTTPVYFSLKFLITWSLFQSLTGVECQKWEPRLSLAILLEDILRSVVAQEVSCLEGDTDPELRLEGDGGSGEVLP